MSTLHERLVPTVPAAGDARRPHDGRPGRVQNRPAQTLAGFLERHRGIVVDVQPGATPVSRRLLVAQGSPSTVTHAVAVAGTGSSSALDCEEQVLRTAAELPAALTRTLPRVVGRIAVGPRQDGLVVTAVPGLGRPGSDASQLRTGQLLVAVGDWLGLLWRESADGESSADLIGDRMAGFLVHYGDSPRLRSAPAKLRAAQDRVSQFPVRLSMGHGCLCTRHTRLGGDRVIGVDDWALGSMATNPLHDLAGFAARTAGRRLLEVLVGRTSYAGMFRQFVGGGLVRLGVPRHLWRDVVLLAQFEIAMAALDRGEPDQMTSLMALLGASVTRTEKATDRGGRP